MKKILFLVLGLLSLIAFTSTYANNDQHNQACNASWAIASWTIYESEHTNRTGGMKTGYEITNKYHYFHTNIESVWKYVTKPLTGTQKETIKGIIKEEKKAIKTLEKTTKALVISGTVDRSGYITQGTKIITDFQTAMMPYIATGKIEKFTTFIQKQITTLQKYPMFKEKKEWHKDEFKAKKIEKEHKKEINQHREENKEFENQTADKNKNK